MNSPRLKVWQDAKNRARAIARQSQHNDWARDVRRLRLALLVEHPILREFSGMSSRIALDAMDLAYLETHPTVPVDPAEIERRYASLAYLLEPHESERTTLPINPEERVAEYVPRYLVFAGAAIGMLLFAVGIFWPRTERGKSVGTAEAVESVDSVRGELTGEQEPDSEPDIETEIPIGMADSEPSVQFGSIQRVAGTEGYFEKDGKLYLQVKAGDRLWNRLWRGPFRFYPSWDETLARLQRYNPDLDPHQISPGDAIVIANLNGVPYAEFLARSLKMDL